MRVTVWARIGIALGIFGGAILNGIFRSLVGVDASRVKARVARVMAGPVLKLARIRVRLTGREKLKGVGSAVLVGNQQSILCYCIHATLVREFPSFGIFARLTGQWDIPFLTLFFRKTENFMVDPQNPLRTAVGFVDARKFLGEGERKVWMGPEGTRWTGGAGLGPFKSGAFRLAIEAQVPVVPMVISPLKPETDLGELRLDPQEVELRVLDPIPTQGKTKKEIRELREEVRDRMQEAFTEMGGDLRNSP